MGTFGATRTIAAGGSVIAHDNLEAAASSAAILLAPLTYSGSDAHVVLFHPDVKGIRVRARGILTARTTDPVVCIYLLYYRDGNVARIQGGDTSIPADGTILTTRLRTVATATVFTLPCTVASMESDSSYKYSPLPANFEYEAGQGDTEGTFYSEYAMVNKAFGMLVLGSTAGSVTGSIEAQVLAV